jgi:eukaryotic-like serine/threonine-protein kinase
VIGRKLSHYRIIEEIGAGGMGVVYRARDERLERDVAIKVLPEQTLTDELARRRFRQEALALSRINHPGIATIYDVGSDGGTDFLVMEFIRGTSLDDRLLMRGPMAEEEVIAVALELANALAAAHDQGVLHRDLKPANLRLTTDGRLKILDFGIAKILPKDVATADVATEVQTQGVSGTFPYMAPEQLVGHGVDDRTDIHAVGAVLYELVTGVRAFDETQMVKLTDAILHRPPPSPRRISPNISVNLDRIITRCLAKKPEDRYQNARELLAAFRTAEPPQTPAIKTIESLAVLPFVSRSPDPNDEYFADGITEELIGALANTQGLRVVSRTSSFAFKGKNIDAREIGRTLNVEVLLEGSVRKQREQLRITAQLIRASDGYHIWSETFDRQLTDVFAIQEEIARSIARKIRPQEVLQVEPPTTNLAAYQLFLQARQLMVRNSIGSLREAIAMLDGAARLDPQFAAAWVQKSIAYRLLVNRTGIATAEGLANATEAARQAIAIDPHLADAYAAIGEIHLAALRWSEAEEALARAIALNPNSAAAHYALSDLHLLRGEHDKALEEVMRSYELDPLTRVSSVGRVLYHAGRYSEALPWFLRAFEANPSSAVFHYYLGMTYAHLGRDRDAVTAMNSAIDLSGDQRWRTHLAHVYVLTGKAEDARRLRAEVMTATPRENYPRVDFAILALALGDREEALDWLEEAHRQNSADASTILSDVELKPLYGDARFQKLLRDVGLR